MMTTNRAEDDQTCTTIKSFFANKNIFVTGGTGFLGAVLVSSLLNTSPDVGTIYVLVRDKYGSNANTRIQRLLTKPLFKGQTENTLKKVVPIVGDLSEKNLGIKDEVLQKLKENVNIIYHSAATIKFNTHLKTAIMINLIGTHRTIEFAKSLKNLVSYVYLSTAFCNSNQRTYIEEKIYPSEQDPYEMMKLAENWNSDSEPDVGALIGNHPNTYTYTKQLAENLILKELAGFPAGIVRPSVVYGTYKNPIQGWVGNATSGHLGLLAGYVKGVFRTISGSSESMIDIIPCDYVINASITMGWYVGTRKLETIEVIHSTAGERNPLTLKRFCEVLNESAPKNPCDQYIWMPQAKIRNGLRFTVFFYLFHFLPAYLLSVPELIFHSKKARKSVVQYMLVFHKGAKAFDFFLDKNFRYSFKNALRIIGKMHPDDVDLYQFDAKCCDWSFLIESCLLGIRRYYFHESYETTLWHKIMYKLFEILHYIGWVFMLVIIYFVILTFVVNVKSTFVIALMLWLFLLWL